MFPAALSFLGDHAALYPRLLLLEALPVYEHIRALYLHKNVELRRAASRAVDATLGVVRHCHSPSRGLPFDTGSGSRVMDRARRSAPIWRQSPRCRSTPPSAPCSGSASPRPCQ